LFFVVGVSQTSVCSSYINIRQNFFCPVSKKKDVAMVFEQRDWTKHERFDALKGYVHGTPQKGHDLAN
jgi:hypothetical protein